MQTDFFVSLIPTISTSSPVLITPIAMSEKLNFAIREGGKTVGAGVVTKIIE